uniref:transposase n=1 Tax=Reticulibacter mediterranei TaxID=2778369 RepID=UPI001F457EED|nr:transposase [Reticulibacter mediterranei]
MVSRDRGGDYAAAARRAVPQAQQVADKFHLRKNLRERLADVVTRRHSPAYLLLQKPDPTLFLLMCEVDQLRTFAQMPKQWDRQTRKNTTARSLQPPMPGHQSIRLQSDRNRRGEPDASASMKMCICSPSKG